MGAMLTMNSTISSYQAAGWSRAASAQPRFVAGNLIGREEDCALIEELMPDYRKVLSRSVVADAIRLAICELRGSICLEALPEMATRLARFRLDKLVESADPDRAE